MKKRNYISNLLGTLLGFFPRLPHKRNKPLPQGNRSLPTEMQKEIMAKAQAKRDRKKARSQGWYNG